jgi:hypothetical protein
VCQFSYLQGVPFKTTVITTLLVSKISGSHGGEFEVDCLMACCRVVLVEVYSTKVLAASIIALMEAASISETSVNFYQTTRQQPSRQPASVFVRFGDVNITREISLQQISTKVSKTHKHFLCPEIL